jgi:CMP-N-acetylneuraminic acid synthetase
MLSLEKEFMEPLFGWDFFMEKRRQDLPVTYSLNGAIYITSPKKFIENNNLFNKRTLPYVMPKEKSIDIDSFDDFELVESILKNINDRNE